MTAVERYFFTPLYYPRSRWSILRWWESRRLLFNLSVGSVGLLSLGTVALIGRLPPHPGLTLLPIPVAPLGWLVSWLF